MLPGGGVGRLDNRRRQRLKDHSRAAAATAPRAAARAGRIGEEGMRRSIIASARRLAIAASVPATAQRAKDDDGGVKVRRPSIDAQPGLGREAGEGGAAAVRPAALPGDQPQLADCRPRIRRPSACSGSPRSCCRTPTSGTRAPRTGSWEVIVVKTPDRQRAVHAGRQDRRVHGHPRCPQAHRRRAGGGARPRDGARPARARPRARGQGHAHQCRHAGRSAW